MERKERIDTYSGLAEMKVSAVNHCDTEMVRLAAEVVFEKQLSDDQVR